MHNNCRQKGVSAVISTGIWPGVDQLMAVEACNMIGGSSNAHSIDYSAFTAGTGKHAHGHACTHCIIYTVYTMYYLLYYTR
jgi:saccharopine dehydrogenase-like NADP-dependent oxidoreductase